MHPNRVFFKTGIIFIKPFFCLDFLELLDCLKRFFGFYFLCNSFLTHRKPLYTYDVGAPVGDVAWAPYCSTTFAAVTTDGKVHVYDMVWDKYKPICVQSIVHRRKATLNQIAFNPSHPIIIGRVGRCRKYLFSSN